MAKKNPAEVKRLETALSLVDQAPSAEEIAAAPLLDNWFLGRSLRSTCLVGEAKDHPELGSNPISTSLVLAMDVDVGWARTISRVYGLGHQLQHDDPRIEERSGFFGILPDDMRKLPKRLNSNREAVEKHLRVLTH